MNERLVRVISEKSLPVDDNGRLAFFNLDSEFPNAIERSPAIGAGSQSCDP